MSDRKPQIINSIELKNLTIGFDGNVTVVDNISCSLPMNEIIHIRGKRGVGKSSLLKILAGLEPPRSGQYLINNENVSNMNFEEFLRFRVNIGYGFEYGGLINNMTVFENLMLPLTYHNNLSYDEAHKRVSDYIEEFGLENAKNQRPAFISGSMRKEVCVLRAFVTEPEVLILDNPTTGINAQNVKMLKQLIWAKKEVGNLKHVYIVSDDEKFLDNLVTDEFAMEWSIAEAS